MNIRTKTLCQVELRHDFYRSGLAEELSVTPTSLCSRLLRNHGLLFRKTAKGFNLLYEYQDNAEQLFKPLAKGIRLSFAITSTNPYLVNFSDLPLDGASGYIYYLSNLNDNSMEDKLRLNSAGEAVGEADRLELRPPVFNYRSASSLASVTIDIINEFGASISHKENVSPVEGFINHGVKLRGYPPGRYVIMIEGARELDFYLSDELTANTPLGVIDILHGSDVPSAYRLVKETTGETNHPVYRVQIHKRKTYWQYSMVLKYRLSGKETTDWPDDWPNNYSILSPDIEESPVSFSRNAAYRRADGAMAVPYRSDTVLPLREQPVKGIRLAKTGSGGTGEESGIGEMENLPNPSVSTLRKDSEDKLYCEVFVYL